MDENKKMSVEEAFVKLDEMVKEMGNPDISLERSFSLYKEGISLVEFAKGEIDTVEKQVLELNDKGETSAFS